MTGLEHVTITALDFAAQLAFYDATLGAAGLPRSDELVDEEEDGALIEAAAWSAPEQVGAIWLVSGPDATRGLHLRLRVADAATVGAVHATALAAGGTSHADPRRWTVYRRGEFGATVRDPAGNLLEVVAPE